jgi:hypothetical protein
MRGPNQVGPILRLVGKICQSESGHRMRMSQIQTEWLRRVEPYAVREAQTRSHEETASHRECKDTPCRTVRRLARAGGPDLSK